MRVTAEQWERRCAGGEMRSFGLILSRSSKGHIWAGNTMRTAALKCKADLESGVEGTPFLTQGVG